MRKLSLLVSGIVVALIAVACVPPPPPPTPHRDVVVFGDSNGWGIGCSIGDTGDIATNPPFPCTPQSFSTKNETLGACSIMGGQALLYNGLALSPSCTDWASSWPAMLDERTPKLVILSTGGWEIIDRWLTLPPGCSAFNAATCPAPDLQWGGDAGKLAAAQARYSSQLLAAINLFRSKGAKVLVTNSAYYAPTEPQVPGLGAVWYEAYPAAKPANWDAPNVNVTYRPSKLKIEQFNASVKSTIDQNFPGDPNVQLFDLWQRVSPVDPGTAAPAYSDFSCGAPNEKQWPPSFCPGAQITQREPDHGHFSFEGYRDVIMPYLLPKIQQMLA